MAMSNWDTFTVDVNGVENEGTFCSMGVSIYFYKNWIYVDDPQGWRAGGSYTKPTVMQIQEGDIRFHDIEIVAWRGPQNGVYAAIWRIEAGGKISGIIGCGVYGFADDGKWLGVTDEALKCLYERNQNEDVPEVPAELLKRVHEISEKRRAQ